MIRKPNTNRSGLPWTPEQKLAVWRKGSVVLGLDINTLREDSCRAIISFSDHGNRNSRYGWEIDHINPVANGGGDEIGNLQPLQWENNVAKGDNLDWNCGQ